VAKPAQLSYAAAPQIKQGEACQAHKQRFAVGRFLASSTKDFAPHRACGVLGAEVSV